MVANLGAVGDREPARRRHLLLLCSSPAEPVAGPPRRPHARHGPAPCRRRSTSTSIVVGTTPLPGVEQPVDRVPAPVQTVDRRRSRQERGARPGRLRQPPAAGRARQRDAGQSVSARRQLSRLHGVAAARHAAGAVGLHGRRAAESAVRRRRELGPDSADGDRLHGVDAGVEPDVRPQHARRCARGAPPRAASRIPAPPSKASYGSDVRRALDFEHGGSQERGASTGTWRARCSPRTAGATTRRRTCGRSSASWDGNVRRGSASVTVAHARNELNGNALQEITPAGSRRRQRVHEARRNRQPRDVRQRGAPPRRLRARPPSPATSYYRDIDTRTFNGDVNEESLDQNLFLPGETAGEHTVSVEPLPRQRAAQRRAGGEVQRPPEPHAHRAAQRRRLGSAHPLRLGGGPPQPAHGRRRLRPQPGGVHAVVRARLPESGSQHHRRERLRRRRCHRRHGRRRALRHARGSRRSHEDVERVCLRHAVVRRSSAPHRGGPLQPHDRGQPRRHPARRRRRARSTGRTCSRASIRPPASRSTPRRGVNLYAGYNEGSRAATSIELGCADPEQPCKLPNAMAGDPPLSQVVTRTLDTGVRGHSGGVAWNASYFRAANRDDILFVQSEQTGFGYFKNFGRTRREGVELGARTRAGRAEVGAGYTLLSATFQSAGTGQRREQQRQRRGRRPGSRARSTSQPGRSDPADPAPHAEDLRRRPGDARARRRRRSDGAVGGRRARQRERRSRGRRRLLPRAPAAPTRTRWSTWARAML